MSNRDVMLRISSIPNRCTARGVRPSQIAIDELSETEKDVDRQGQGIHGIWGSAALPFCGTTRFARLDLLLRVARLIPRR